jgi:hypothetical protein
MFLCYKLDIISRLLSMVIHALEYFRCLKNSLENRLTDKYVVL